MLYRYTQLMPFIAVMEDHSLQRMKLWKKQNDKLDTFMLDVEELESVTKAWQEDSTTLSAARAMLDAVSEQYPQLLKTLL